MSKRVKKTKKAPRKVNGVFPCQLRILRGHKRPHGPDGVRMRLEIEFDEGASIAAAARFVELSE